MRPSDTLHPQNTTRCRRARVSIAELARSAAAQVGVLACSVGLLACHDPGREALDRTLRGVESLVSLAERRARGELGEADFIAALRAWERTEAVEIRSLAEDAGRALGPARREALAEAWREASERLGRRLSAGVLPGSEIATEPSPKPPSP